MPWGRGGFLVATFFVVVIFWLVFFFFFLNEGKERKCQQTDCNIPGCKAKNRQTPSRVESSGLLAQFCLSHHPQPSAISLEETLLKFFSHFFPFFLFPLSFHCFCCCLLASVCLEALVRRRRKKKELNSNRKVRVSFVCITPAANSP